MELSLPADYDCLALTLTPSLALPDLQQAVAMVPETSPCIATKSALEASVAIMRMIIALAHATALHAPPLDLRPRATTATLRSEGANAVVVPAIISLCAVVACDWTV